ncbi:MAG: alpha/beta hydrolase [Gemmatimonadota bacterium]
MSRTALLCLALLLPAAAAAQSLQDRFFDSGGVRIRYIDVGSGEPVLLIHGFAVDLDVNWVGPGIVAALVDAGYRVIAYDDRGQGRSDKPHDPAAYGAPEIRDVVRLLDRLGIDRVDIVGYSRGGLIGMELWAMDPERVRTLVLAASPGPFRLRSAPGLTRDQFADSVAAGSPGPVLRRLAPAGGRAPAVGPTPCPRCSGARGCRTTSPPSPP